eukprot:scaffold766_cov210-Alexandrium_tamarense.AAC.35
MGKSPKRSNHANNASKPAKKAHLAKADKSAAKESKKSSAAAKPASTTTVDTDALTVGSMVVVDYQGGEYNAFIAQRGTKKRENQFQVQFEGNKRTMLHWIPQDTIRRILSPPGRLFEIVLLPTVKKQLPPLALPSLAGGVVNPYPPAPPSFKSKVHSMVSKSSANKPDVLRWTPDGRGFFIGDEVRARLLSVYHFAIFSLGHATSPCTFSVPSYSQKKMPAVLVQYFENPKFANFIKMLKLNGWKKKTKGTIAGAFVHPNFHRDVTPPQFKMGTKRTSLKPTQKQIEATI